MYKYLGSLIGGLIALSLAIYNPQMGAVVGFALGFSCSGLGMVLGWRFDK